MHASQLTAAVSPIVYNEIKFNWEFSCFLN
jgi:hypothetical protein